MSFLASSQGSSDGLKKVVTEIGLLELNIRQHLFHTVTCEKDEDVQPGDVLLFDIENKTWFKHAALCYEPGLIIHKIGVQRNPDGSQEGEEKEGAIGEVKIDGIKRMLEQRTLFNVFRPNFRIQLEQLKRKVTAAMNKRHIYHLLKDNCIHFVLELLGMRDEYDEVVSEAKPLKQE
ncbi:uncharacterized protein LOC144771436 [Lissotriton helveticus]